jgi:hypothetical protein
LLPLSRLKSIQGGLCAWCQPSLSFLAPCLELRLQFQSTGRCLLWSRTAQYATCLENSKSLMQSCVAFFEQCFHFALTEYLLDFIPFLLCFNESINFVKSSVSKSVRRRLTPETYSTNFPVWSATEGCREPAISDFIWSSTIAYRTLWIFSIRSVHSFLFRFTV